MKRVTWKREYETREHTTELDQLLRPNATLGGEGQVEQAQAQADANADAIGRLLAALELRGVLTLAVALEIANVYVRVLKQEEV